MRKNVATDSSRGQSFQSQQTLSEESTLEGHSELSTVLGEYAASPVDKKSNTSLLSFLPVLLILFLVVTLGAGGYVYWQKNNIAQMQAKITQMQTNLGTMQVMTEKIASSASLTLGNDRNAWKTLDANIKLLNNTWANTQTLVPELDEYAKLKNELNQAVDVLSKHSSMIIATLDKVGTESVGVEDIRIARDKVNDVTSRAQALTGKINSILTDVSKHTPETGPDLEILNMVFLGAGILALLMALIISKQFIVVKRGRGQEMGQLSALVEDLQSEAERQRYAAQEQVAAARRVNEANQAAILRLMNELQNLAEGDLTQQATVTEDITGAIADSVNYTVEELRTLVSQVQAATVQVSKTTAVVESTSTELLASSDEQLHEIRETGQAILDVAKRINTVSSQAQQSAQVATQSLAAADKGLNAVQNAIGGMNTIRGQIQDTSKRIKRLVESSQEIGEITDLIADITEQTNVLALNAAIQAASAGEAGRGFSVVAEEVQRLAERSAHATRQIASLVKTIQEDMQDAMAAMERSTQGVVEGARLSDETGTAFSEINTVAKKLANLIQQISEQAENEANVANSVADNIQHIFAVTEQTADGTRSTAQQVRELARVANQLERSVARFKIS